jgi:hypothetical protein
MVFDGSDDIAGVVAGVSRFLAVESCGQCTPCKQDGLALADLLRIVCAGEGEEHHLAEIRKRAGTVGDRARCYLALQHQAVITSLLERFPGALEAHVTGAADPVDPVLVAELVDLQDGKVLVDERFREKQPDWTYGEEYSGKAPADRYAEHRSDEAPEG